MISIWWSYKAYLWRENSEVSKRRELVHPLYRQKGPKSTYKSVQIKRTLRIWEPLHLAPLSIFSFYSTRVAHSEAIKLIYGGRIPKWKAGVSWATPGFGKKGQKQCKSRVLFRHFSGVFWHFNPFISLGLFPFRPIRCTPDRLGL